MQKTRYGCAVLIAMGAAVTAGCGADPTAAEWEALPEQSSAPATASVEMVASAQSSLDYPGPCQQEAVAANAPQFIATSNRSGLPNQRIYHFAKIDLPDTGRFKLGISCTRTKFVVLRGGPGSALCTQRQNCGPNLPPEDFDWAVNNGLPYNERPFVHHCDKHGFGWYDATSVPPGSYFVAADSGSIPIFFEGHGTMDSYAFTGNGGQFQPVNCAPPNSGGGGGGGGGGGDDPNQVEISLY